MKKMVFWCFLNIVFVVQKSISQNLSGEKIKALTDNNLLQSITNLRYFLTLKNDGRYPEQVAENMSWCDSVFKALDFNTQTLKTEGAPLLFAEKIVDKKKGTILFYLQIDGQPTDRMAWAQPDPFNPVLKEKHNGSWEAIPYERLTKTIDPDWRIFSRSASDSKGPAMAFITALQIYKRHHLQPQYNIKVIMDFQEELGSPYLPMAVERNKELLLADMLLIMDGTRHLSNLPTLTYGARGIATATIRVFGPKYALHSGQYGNFAPNPVYTASELIASLKNEVGRVTIPGFYDGVILTPRDKALLAKIPENMDSTLQVLGTASPEAVAPNYQEALQYPSLNVRGLSAGWVGKEARTIIPPEVTIEMDLRLVPETDGLRQINLLKNYIVKKGFYLVDSIPSDEERKIYPKLASFTYKLGSKPFRTEMESPIGRFANKALSKVFGDNIVNMRTTGGSQPIAPFVQTLNIPAISVRIPNPDNSIHGPNENLRIGNFKEGIMTCLAILSEPL